MSDLDGGPGADTGPGGDTEDPTAGAGVGRTLVYALSVAAIVLAVVLVPLPWVEYAPGQPTAIPPLIEVTGTEVTEIEGETALLTVYLRDATVWTAARVLLDPARELTPSSQLAPEGLTPEFFAAQRESFARTFQVATAVGARAAGVDVDVRTEVRVVDVLAGSPADGTFAPGDRIVALDGQPLTDAAVLQARTRAAEDGDELTVTIEHGGTERDATIVLRPLEDGGEQVGLGIVAETRPVGLDLPFEVTLGDTSIGGPSAGMMTALTIYDLLSDEDLIAGRTVVGTGSVAASGRVGQVGGVPEKVRSAAAYGADVVLVPAEQLEAARRAAPDDLEVIGVETVQDAIAALRGG